MGAETPEPKRYALSAEEIEAKDAREKAEVEQNLTEHGTVYDPYGDSAARITYLQAKYGGSGRSSFFDRMDAAEKERLGLIAPPAERSEEQAC